MPFTSQPWFSITNGNSHRQVLLTQHPTGSWEAEDLVQFRLPSGQWPETLIEGKAPVWMYAHVAAWAARHGAPVIKVLQAATADAPTTVHPLSSPEDPETAGEWLKISKLAPTSTTIEFLPNRHQDDEKWPTSKIADLATSFSGLSHGEQVILTGRGAVWMYAAAAAVATMSDTEVFCMVPQFGLDRLLRVGDGDAGALTDGTSPISPPGAGLILGIVGDPNSGKSVFANIAQRALSQLGLRCWTLDCDFASPTPKWYLDSLGTNEEDLARLRNLQKRKWTHQMEVGGATQLEKCRNTFDVLIADLPGGIHRDDGSLPERIPEGREALLSPVDRFIIIGREDNDATRGWTAELGRIGMGDRIAAKILSLRPNSATPELNVEELPGENPLWSGRAIGLDRKAARQIPPPAFAFELGRLIDSIMTARKGNPFANPTPKTPRS